MIYDLINTTIEYRNSEDEIALPIKGKKKDLTHSDLINYLSLERCELTTKSIDKVLETSSTALPTWKSIIDTSFLSKGMKEKYLDLIDLRLNKLKIS